MGLVGLLTLCSPSFAVAQPPVEGAPRVEVGVVASGMAPLRARDPQVVPGVGIRLTVARTPRLAFEISADLLDFATNRKYAGQLTGIYSWQLRHTVWSRSRSAAFATYGTAGWLQRRQTAPVDGFETGVILPRAPTAGIGVQHVLNRYIAVRGDLQLVVFWPTEGGVLGALRFGGGLSIPIGRYVTSP